LLSDPPPLSSGVMREPVLICVFLVFAGCATPKPPLVVGDPGWPEDRASLSHQIVYFESHASSLDAGAMRKIGEVAAYLKANPSVFIKVEGHADDLVSEEENRVLGNSRAEAAQNELVRMGIDPSWTYTVSYGPDQLPVAKKYGRCAEFVLLTPPRP
jgi:outer membrane protein OmpA-like peptidoglycan-associated protein